MMKQPELVPFSPAEKKRVLRQALAAGTLGYDLLDQLLVEACATDDAMSALLKSLEGVRIVDSWDPEDVLAVTINRGATTKRRWSEDDLGLYNDQARSAPRMSRGQEHLLARRLEFTRARMGLIVDGSKLPDESRDRILERGLNCSVLRGELELQDDLSAVEVDEILSSLPCAGDDILARDVVAQYNRLRSHFVERNLYLVIGMASAYRTYGLPMMDLIQEGNASLIRAVEKYDWRKGVRFQTYAAFWVRQAVERLITANRGIVRVPNYIQQKMRRLRREGKLPRNHKDVDLKDVSTLFDTSTQAAVRLMATDRAWFSLDAPLGDEEQQSFAAQLEADESDESLSAGENRALAERLEEVFVTTRLSEQERQVLIERFGLSGTPRRTLEQIGQSMNVSRERIRQMQVKAMSKLKGRMAKETLKDFL
ncbi:MAG: RNA polymerase primary sigma factor [Pseudohongiellaceae bacterium]|jgi:RNA polymerase primary sigma factor